MAKSSKRARWSKVVNGAASAASGAVAVASEAVADYAGAAGRAAVGVAGKTRGAAGAAVNVAGSKLGALTILRARRSSSSSEEEGGAAGDSHQGSSGEGQQQSAESTGRLGDGKAQQTTAAPGDLSAKSGGAAGDAVDPPRGSKRAGDPGTGPPMRQDQQVHGASRKAILRKKVEKKAAKKVAKVEEDDES